MAKLPRTGRAAARASAPRGTADRAPWSAVGHLSGTEEEARLANIELAVERMMHSYHRWKAACLETVVPLQLTGDDITILNIVRVDQRPKRLTEVAGILNRTDTSNLQYAMRKLIKAGLIEKVNGDSRRDTAYRATERGVDITNRYAEARRRLLVGRLDRTITDGDLQGARDLIQALTGCYEAATSEARVKRLRQV
jgi:predicted MarR family transcription regulator